MRTLIALLVALTMTALIGCSKQEEEGPAEQAGKKVDEAVEQAESYTSEKLKEAGEAIEQAGEDMEKKD